MAKTTALVLLALTTTLVGQEVRSQPMPPMPTQKGQTLQGTAELGSNARYFGWSVALAKQGTVMAVGALVGNSDRGVVRVYELLAGMWQQLGADIVGDAELDYFGFSVSLSANGTRVAVGARQYSSNRGRVRVFEFVNSAWTSVGAAIDGEAASDVFGVSVSLSANGTRVAVGAPNNNGGGSNSGRVRVFEFVDSAW